VEIVEVGLVSLGLTSGTAEVTLEVTNVGSRRLKITGLGYLLEVQGRGGDEGWEKLAQDVRAEEYELLGKEVQRIVLPVSFEYQALGAAVQSFLTRGEVPYRIQGEVSVRGFGMTIDVPFRSRGTLKP
jgi:hypothetical protein